VWLLFVSWVQDIDQEVAQLVQQGLMREMKNRNMLEMV